MEELRTNNKQNDENYSMPGGIIMQYFCDLSPYEPATFGQYR